MPAGDWLCFVRPHRAVWLCLERGDGASVPPGAVHRNMMSGKRLRRGWVRFTQRGAWPIGFVSNRASRRPVASFGGGRSRAAVRCCGGVISCAGRDANFGSASWGIRFWDKTEYRGVMGQNTKLAFQYISDGLSHTVAVAEIQIQPDYSDNRGVWAFPAAGASSVGLDCDTKCMGINDDSSTDWIPVPRFHPWRFGMPLSKYGRIQCGYPKFASRWCPLAAL